MSDPGLVKKDPIPGFITHLLKTSVRVGDAEEPSGLGEGPIAGVGGPRSLAEQHADRDVDGRNRGIGLPSASGMPVAAG